jgi:TetR/AcrR family transcriptional regulator, tetracycline repressor protein
MDERKIIDVTRGMLETGGLASLSMRKLATELGVAPTAIYWHVGGREELLGRVLDEMVAEMPPVQPAGTTPSERLRSIAHQLREQVRATPVLRQLAIDLGRTAEVALPAQIAVATEMTAAGLSGAAAARASQALLFTVGGFILLDTALGHRFPDAPKAHELWAGLAPEGLDAELVAAMARPPDVEAIFTEAVDRLLDALLPR